MQKILYIGNNWEFGLYWRKDFKFIGFIEDFGFGRYIGIRFKFWEV